MTDRLKNRVLIVLVLALLFGFAVALLTRTPDAISNSERRKLAQPPVLSVESLFSGKFRTQTEAFVSDQFPLREPFRALAAGTRLGAFLSRDTNGVYYKDGGVYKLEYPLNEASVQHAAAKISELTALLPDAAHALLAVVPDKNYYAASANGYPAMDYDALYAMMQESLPQLQCIDLRDCLASEDYYATDTHWRQERLDRVYDRLASEMRLGTSFSDQRFTESLVGNFYGVLYGQGALPHDPDLLTVLTNEAIASAKVYNLEKDAISPVYSVENVQNMDPYDVFLGGAAAYLEITNPQSDTPRELVVFRDSFGSSLVPLLIGSYRKITVIDTRYFHPSLIQDYVTFLDQDVLFLYSTLILNSSDSLK